MKIKKYVARDFQTALKQAKNEMGRDAIILHSRQVKRKGLLGIIYPQQVEITVATDDGLQVNTDIIRNQVREQGISQAAPNSRGNSAIWPPLLAEAEEGDVLQELQRMKDLMKEIQSRMVEVDIIKGMSEQVRTFYEALIQNNVDRDIALEIVNDVETRLPGNGDQAWARDVCLHTLQEYLKDVRPISLQPNRKSYLVFVVGPTGVGKTTTIAKLAANMSLLEGKQVALITMDTYRISAAEQLRTFADIIGIPISVVFTPGDFHEAMQQFREEDIIFVDTAGRSPHNQKHMAELQEFIDSAHPDETILVLSATTSTSDLINIYRQFVPLGIDKVIFTKLDETYCYGPIINTIKEIKKPIAYFTTGQNVPDDIEVPDTLHIARMLLRRDETS